MIPSQTNFIFVKPKSLRAKELFTKLREKKILTRWFDTKACRSWLRITIGTEREMDKFLLSTKAIVENHKQR